MYSLMMSANGHVDPRGTLPPPIIMRTAATPMPTPKSSLGPESVFGSAESRRGSGVSIDPNAFDQKSLVRTESAIAYNMSDFDHCIDVLLLFQTSPRRSPCHPRGSGSNWGSRRSSWNSLGRAPSLKRKDTSGERESLLSGEGRGSFEDEDSEGDKMGNIIGGSIQHPISLDIPELPQDPSFSSLGEYHDCNGRTLHLPTDLSTSLAKEDSITEEEDLDDVSDGVHTHTIFIFALVLFYLLFSLFCANPLFC